MASTVWRRMWFTMCKWSVMSSSYFQTAIYIIGQANKCDKGQWTYQQAALAWPEIMVGVFLSRVKLSAIETWYKKFKSAVTMLVCYIMVYSWIHIFSFIVDGKLSRLLWFSNTRNKGPHVTAYDLNSDLNDECKALRTPHWQVMTHSFYFNKQPFVMKTKRLKCESWRSLFPSAETPCTAIWCSDFLCERPTRKTVPVAKVGFVFFVLYTASAMQATFLD